MELRDDVPVSGQSQQTHPTPGIPQAKVAVDTGCADKWLGVVPLEGSHSILMSISCTVVE